MTAQATDNIVDFYRPQNENDPTLLSYSLKSMEELATSRGVAWTAVITRNSEKVGTVENMGDGGCNKYLFIDKIERDLFFTTAQLIYGGIEHFEGEEEDILAAWLDIKANYSSN